MFSHKKTLLLITLAILVVSAIASASILTRRQPKIVVGASGEIQISPTSGNWNYPITFLVKNISTSTITIHWFLDCWDTTFCSDSEGNTTLAPQQSFTKGLGDICSKWQLDVSWPGSSWGGIAEISTTKCNASPSPTPTRTPTPTATSTPTRTPTPNPTSSPTSTPTRTPTPNPLSSPTPTATPGPSSTPAPSSTPPPGPTSTPQPGPTSTPQPQPTPTPQTELPRSGSATPTWIISLEGLSFLILGTLLFAI